MDKPMFWNSWLSEIMISLKVHLHLRGFSFSAPLLEGPAQDHLCPENSPSNAQDLLFLCQNRFFDTFLLWDWRPFSFCISLLSGRSPFSLQSTLLSLDNIFNGVPYNLRNDDLCTVGAASTVVMSQDSKSSPGYNGIPREGTADVTGE